MHLQKRIPGSSRAFKKSHDRTLASGKTRVVSKLAIDGGKPVRSTFLPYGRQSLDDDDRDAVMEVLKGAYLTTGPAIAEFESALQEATGAKYAVALSSGTAALHLALESLALESDDEVIVPAITFAATATAVLMAGGRPVIADVAPGDAEDGLLLSPEQVTPLVGPKTRAVIAVDFAGRAADARGLGEALGDDIEVLVDACHSLGASRGGIPVGRLAPTTILSFHPVKGITTGEGGAVLCDDAGRAKAVRRLRNHAINKEYQERQDQASHAYDIPRVGYNYRITDIQAALGTSQLKKLPGFLEKRRKLAGRYSDALEKIQGIGMLATGDPAEHAFHLMVVLLDLDALSVDRDQVFRALHAEGIGVNVHYKPLNLLTVFQKASGVGPGHCPNAEDAYARMLTLPLHPSMTESDVDDVLAALRKVLGAYRR
jgi:perosamine synthetase